MDTIYAVATGAPPAAIAIMRLSGAGAMDAATALAGNLPPAHAARLRSLRHPQTGVLIDRCVVIVYPGPNSATGEDVVELQLHGGRAVVAAVADALSGISGLRQAEPGEFTRRALMNDRIDLAQAEGLGDLLTAETETQRRVAMAANEGAVSRAVAAWNVELLAFSAIVESQLDFSDEDDVSVADTSSVSLLIARSVANMAGVLETPSTSRLRDGVRIVLGGPPNSGKSTLFNILADREAAIVSPIAGTTRDRIEAPVVHDGVAFILIDTAGLARDTIDPVERIGVERAQAAIHEADILLWLGDEPPPVEASHVVWLWPSADGDRAASPTGRLPVSAVSGSGIAPLWSAIMARARSMLPREDQLALNDRQHALCRECLSSLEAAACEPDLLLVAEQLRLARRSLDRVTGRSDVEAMLDSLFGNFCIGK